MNCKAVRFDIRLRSEIDFGIGKRGPLGNENLGFDDINPRDFFGNGVFNLDSRIDFDEVEVVLLRVKQEFHGSGIFIADRAADLEG